MANDPLAPTVKPTAPGAAQNRPADTSAGPRKTAPAQKSHDDGDEAPEPVISKPSPWTTILGILAVILLVAVVVLAVKGNARDRTLEETRNRSAQLQAATVQLQSQVDEAKSATAMVQKKLDDADAHSDQLKSDLEKSKAAVADLQSRLDKALASATKFQTLAEEAKVASLKHQGEVEVAHAQTAVMLEQLNKTRADGVDLRSQLKALQGKLDQAEAEIARLQKAPAKK